MASFKHKNLTPELRLILGILRSFLVIFCLLSGVAGVLHAHTFTDIGSAAPSPGANDIYQLSTSGNQTWPDGLNYFTDNNPPVGQTFTTGTSATNLVSVAIKTAGLNSGNGYGTPASTPTYYLRIYSMSGSTATLLNTFSAPNPGFTDGDWLQWSGLNVSLAANKTYAFSFGIQPTGGGWAALAVATGAYAGGEIAIIPISGGTITTGSSHSFDAVFSLGLRTTNSPVATSPLPNPCYGWNLGNTLESTWGFPSPKQALFNSAANAGFNAVRIPCAWNFNATTNATSNATNYQINATYMAQVKQAVDWALAAGMTVVINDHWDNGWLDSNLSTTVNPTVNAKMNSYWTQIATAFAGYDNHLLFAAANEPPSTSPAEVATLMVYYQTFVNAVRGGGGNNTNRWLVLQGSGDTSWLNSLPADPTPNRLMVEYHNYTPFQFTQLSSDASWGNMFYFWGPAYHYSGDPTRNATWGEEGYIDLGFQQLTDQYVSKGIPVMVGEFQAAGKSFLTGTEATYNSASAHYWNKYLAESARAHGLSPFYWSTPGSPFDWNTGAITDPQVVTALTGGTAPPPPNGAPYAASGLTATAGNGQVALSWTAGSGATSYNLYRAAESGYESPIAPVVTGITNTSYTDTNLNSGTTYYYQVVAVNGSGPTGFSPEAHATTPGVNLDPAQFNFETDPQGWAASGGQIAGVATSTAQHFAGNQSLAVNFNGTAAGTSSVSLGSMGENLAINAGTTITFHVWIPSGSKITTLQPYLEAYNWAWTSVGYGNLTANAWNTVTVTVPPTAETPLQQLGIEFTTSAAWSGTCYIDSVAWNILWPANTPPTLAPIANQTVNVGQTVAFTASATDTDQPPQTLTFALLAGAANATLNTNSGAFSFRPLVAQANSTNGFTLKVSDNGTPPLSATQSFLVLVNPLSAPGISNISFTGGQFSFKVNGQNGPDYSIEASTNLMQWSSVFITNSPAVPFVWTDTNSTAPQRFYRIKLGPPLP